MSTTHPLLTTAECPKRLTSRCSPGLGRTVHSSQAEDKHTHIHRWFNTVFKLLCVWQTAVRKRTVCSFSDNSTPWDVPIWQVKFIHTTPGKPVLRGRHTDAVWYYFNLIGDCKTSIHHLFFFFRNKEVLKLSLVRRNNRGGWPTVQLPPLISSGGTWTHCPNLFTLNYGDMEKIIWEMTS